MSNSRVVRKGRGRVLRFAAASDGATTSGAEVGPDCLAAVEQDAYRKGFEAGKNAGMEMAEKKIEAILGRFAASIEQVAGLRSQIIRETQLDVVKLALQIARKLVHREITVDPDIILTLVKVALDKLQSQARIVIHLNPEDAAILTSKLEQDPQLFGERDIQIKTKSSLRRGDCLIESPYGSVDGQLSEQFDQIEAGLLSEF
ncbi:MAG: FliH/SctL family protein [Acidobacteriota bacterium]